jgi:alpha-D-ribose 1-methylphosphonate 5-triphosphate synthase subunit PhnG
MLQIDGTSTDGAPTARQRWLRLLSHAPLELLESAIGTLAGPNPQWLRRPETGLVMVQGRIGGTGARFNLGEVTVTRCALRTDPARIACREVGVAYVLGRSGRHAELAATADALLQDSSARTHVPADLLEHISAWLENKHAKRRAQAHATRVEFFTIARESAGEPAAQEAP